VAQAAVMVGVAALRPVALATRRRFRHHKATTAAMARLMARPLRREAAAVVHLL